MPALACERCQAHPRPDNTVRCPLPLPKASPHFAREKGEGVGQNEIGRPLGNLKCIAGDNVGKIPGKVQGRHWKGVHGTEIVTYMIPFSA